MKQRLILLIAISSALINISACTYIKNLFPDKEKDYQYTTEIPPLILPEDLKRDQQISLVANTKNKSTSNTNSVEPTKIDSQLSHNIGTEKISNSDDAHKSNTIIESEESLIDNTAKVNESSFVKRLQIIEQDNQFELNTPALYAWRNINKVLSRKAIEIIDRNQDTKIFTVHFDPDEQKVVEESYWQKTVSFFEDLGPTNDIYFVKLQETNQKTTLIYIVDEHDKKLINTSSNQLLSIIKTALKEDLIKQ